MAIDTSSKTGAASVRHAERSEDHIGSLLADVLELLKAARPDRSVPSGDWETWWMSHDSATRRLEAIVKKDNR